MSNFNPEKHKGGDVILRPGIGFSPDPIALPPVGGDFIFQLPGGKEFLRIKPDGSFLVRGDKVEGADNLYSAFREWLRHASATLPS